ncbi:MAG: hypothetical protein D6729_12910 [Deltaproteobacteria bacterium]|nr:MAG: hypothetical protein D6729_12910 [Deltaproteobacteria bacterium]
MSGAALRVLGPPSLVREGAAITLPTAKAWALLAYLAVEGPQRRDHLAALLWEREERRARANLRRELHRIRRALACIEEDSGRLRLVGISSDLETFLKALSLHDWARATAVARGAFLEGVDVREAPRFDEWLEATRFRLELRRQEALLKRARDAFDAGRLEDALGAAETLLLLDTSHEEAHALRLEVLYRLGRGAEARAVHDRFVERLRIDLDTAPSTELRTLYAALEAGTLPAAFPQRHRRPNALRPPRLVGREEVWEQVETAEGLVLVVGEGGLGKSRLLEDFARTCPDARFVRHREGLSRVGFGGVSETLRDLLETGTLEGLEQPWREELARLLPELGTAPPSPSRGESPLTLSRLWEALARALTLDLPPGAALVFDDLHQADAATLAFLPYLARRTCRLGFRPLGGARPEGLRPAHGLAAARRELGREGLFTQITLHPLDETETRQLLELLLGGGACDPALGQEVHRATRGNPLFVLRTLEYLLAQEALQRQGSTWRRVSDAPDGSTQPLPLPRSIQEEVVQGIDSVGGRRAAEILAVAETPLDAFDLRRMLGGSTLAWAEALEALEAAGYLGADERGYAYAHDLFRTAVLQATPRSRSRLLHGVVADDLLARGEAPYRHLEAAGRIDEAWQSALAAGRRALERQAFPVAAEVLLKARELQLRSGAKAQAQAEVLLCLEEALMLAARIPEQQQQIEALEALAPRLSPPMQAEVAFRRVRALGMAGKWTEALERADALLDTQEHTATRLLRADLLANLGRPGAREEALRVWEIAREQGDETVLGAAAYFLAKLGVTTEAGEELERWLVEVERLGRPGLGEVRLKQFTCAAALGACRWEEALREATCAHATAERLGYQEALEAYQLARLHFGELGRRHFQSGVEVNLAGLLLRLGAFQAAEEWARGALERFRAIQEPRGATEAARALAAARLWQQDFREAEALLEESLTLSQEAKLPQSAQQTRADLGVIRLLQGHPEAAEPLLKEAANEACPDWPSLAAWRSLALLRQEATSAARALAERAYAAHGEYTGPLPDVLPLSLAAAGRAQGEDATAALATLDRIRSARSAQIPGGYERALGAFEAVLDAIFLGRTA